jgi:hypothetical protein
MTRDLPPVWGLGKSKGKVVPVLFYEHHAFLASELDGSGQLHAPAALPPGIEPLVPIG